MGIVKCMSLIKIIRKIHLQASKSPKDHNYRISSMYRDAVGRSSSQQHHLGMKCEVREATEQLSRVSLHAESPGPQLFPQRRHTPHPPSLGDAP